MNEDFFDFLILQGAVEPAGIDSDTGEMLYSFTSRLKEVDPKFFNKVMEAFHKNVMVLWEKGFLNIDMLDDQPQATLTRKAVDKDEIAELSEELQEVLKEVKRMMKI